MTQQRGSYLQILRRIACYSRKGSNQVTIPETILAGAT